MELIIFILGLGNIALGLELIRTREQSRVYRQRIETMQGKPAPRYKPKAVRTR